MLAHLKPGSPLLRTTFFCIIALITVASLLPSGGEMRFPHQDKVLHLGAYLFLYSFGWYSFRPSAQPLRTWLAPLFIGLILYGIAIELLQGMTGYRDRDVFDLLANITGLTLGLGAVLLYCRIWKPQHKE